MQQNLTNFTLLPAIDVQNGQAVRLTKGELGLKTNYGTPKDVAKEFVSHFDDARAKYTDFTNPWVHLVDLNAAFGDGDNSGIIADVAAYLTENGVNVELSGGIRDDESLERALNCGAARVNVGTAALENPAWVSSITAKYANRIGIGLDTRGDTLAARGWVKDGGNLWEVAKRLLNDGVTRFVVTDVTKDGTLTGVNTDLLREFATFCTDNQLISAALPLVTASGGISSLDDISKVQELCVITNGIVDSVIFGKAMYSGRFTLTEALHRVYA